MELLAESLVVVFDSTRVRYFERNNAGKLTLKDELDSGLHRSSRELVTDRQGRGVTAGNGAHHAFEPKHDKHKLEKHNFVHEIAAALNAAYDKHNFSSLTIVAPKRSLGEFRALASDNLQSLSWREVPKDFSAYSEHELEKRLQPYF